VSGDRRVDQIAEKRAQPRERSLLVGTRESTVTDDIGDQDRRDFSILAYGAALRGSGACQILMHKGDRDASFTDSGGDALHGAVAHIPASEDAGQPARNPA
jgi:hypothetical protein